MPSFRNAPKAKPAVLVVATPSDAPGMWDCTAGEEDVFPISDELLRKFGHPIHRADNNGEGFYALALDGQEPVAYSIDHDAQIVEFENGETKPLKDFITGSVRVDKDGKTVCSFVEPLHVQYSICKEANAIAHLADVQQTVAHARGQGFSPNVGMYDIIVSGLEDEIPFFERMRAAMAPSWSEEAIAALERTGAPAHAWGEIKDHPHYTHEAVRVMFRDLMGPYIGAFPIERVKTIAGPPGANVEGLLELAFPRTATNAPFRAPNIMPGYETSDVAVFGDEHVEVIVFSDPVGVYAYAWPRQPRPENVPNMEGPRA